MRDEIKNKIVPKLRFPVFKNAEEWEEKSLGSVCETFSGGTPSTSQKEFYGGDIPFIRSAEIDKETTELFITKEGLENSSAKLINKGDVLVALYGANSGEVALAKLNGAINQAILCLRSAESNPFIYQFLTLKKNWIVSTYIQGGQGNLSGEIVKSIKLLFPKPNEQQKIADCLSSLDAFITTQSQKLEALQIHKKGLMQQLFPAEGEMVPKMRFGEFTDSGEWDENTLGNIATFLKGKGISKSDVVEKGNLECIRYGELYTYYKEIIDSVKSYTNLPSEDLVLSEANDVIIPSSGETKEDIATASCVLRSGIALGGDLNIIRSEINGIFLSYYLSNAKKSSIAKLAQGDAVVHLYLSQLEKLKINFPKLKDEQLKIADCLSTLDELIAVLREKIEALKMHKKGLMQGLFPNINDVS